MQRKMTDFSENTIFCRVLALLRPYFYSAFYENNPEKVPRYKNKSKKGGYSVISDESPESKHRTSLFHIM